MKLRTFRVGEIFELGKTKYSDFEDNLLDPFKKMYPEEFKNPFSHEETLEKLKCGGFENLYDFFDVVIKIKTINRELFKKWWLEDGTKVGALDIIALTTRKD